jgi:nucleotide-binding universal stress UspA family protein
MSNFKHILMPTDFETPSSYALELAIGLAQAFDANLTLLHVWEIPAYPYNEVMLSNGDLASSMEKAAAKRLTETLRHVQERLPRANSELRTGVPWREVVASAGALGADLIVMGTHGRRGLTHAFLGSVAEKVVRASPVPVLTTHGPAA